MECSRVAQLTASLVVTYFRQNRRAWKLLRRSLHVPKACRQLRVQCRQSRRVSRCHQDLGGGPASLKALGQHPRVDYQSLEAAKLLGWRHALPNDLYQLQQHAVQLLYTHHERVQGTVKGPDSLVHVTQVLQSSGKVAHQRDTPRQGQQPARGRKHHLGVGTLPSGHGAANHAHRPRDPVSQLGQPLLRGGGGRGGIRNGCILGLHPRG